MGLYCSPVGAITVPCGQLECAETAEAGDACGFASLGWTCEALVDPVGCEPAVLPVVTQSIPPIIQPPVPFPTQTPLSPSNNSASSFASNSAIASIITLAIVAVLAVTGLIALSNRRKKEPTTLVQTDDILPAPSDPAHFLNQKPSMRSLPALDRTPAFFYKDDFDDDQPLFQSIPVADIAEFGRAETLRRHNEDSFLVVVNNNDSNTNDDEDSLSMQERNRLELENLHKVIMKHQGKLELNPMQAADA
ncbi:hypothetical protein BDR26DRAFT_871992 [Obelidium mucronatum]|nr:hypothetical protein BDR26DRAFT_871992 [Obelidium mucronatum]